MALAGDLSDFGLAELLQILSMGRKSGTLSLTGDRSSGTLTLASGRLIAADVAGGPVGEPAFFSLFRNTSGSFRFETADGDPLPAQTVNRPLESLLLEATQLLP